MPTRAIARVAPFNVAVALLVLGAGLVAPDGPGRGRPGWNDLLWLAAGLAVLATSVARLEEGFLLDAGHFAERHGLIILIALGESVVGLGAGAGDAPLRPPLVAAAALGLALAAALWWSYFDRDDVRAEHALARAAPPARARLAILAYWHAHLLMIAGVVLTAAGVQGAVADVASPGARPATPAAGWSLAVGVACYLAGEAAFRRLLGIGPARARVATAGLALATAPAAVIGGGLLQLGALVVLVVGLLVAEARGGVHLVRHPPEAPCGGPGEPAGVPQG